MRKDPIVAEIHKFREHHIHDQLGIGGRSDSSEMEAFLANLKQ
jgi:hypothetical protein